jgi:hypothetical protein
MDSMILGLNHLSLIRRGSIFFSPILFRMSSKREQIPAAGVGQFTIEQMPHQLGQGAFARSGRGKKNIHAAIEILNPQVGPAALSRDKKIRNIHGLGILAVCDASSGSTPEGLSPDHEGVLNDCWQDSITSRFSQDECQPE